VLKKLLKTAALLSINTIPKYTLIHVPASYCMSIVVGDSCVLWFAVVEVLIILSIAYGGHKKMWLKEHSKFQDLQFQSQQK
jgi:hypothetical protein